ncbi:MAG: (d)CMP kinase [Sphaerochaetaceae bacterium]|nr:(d)CMP kinase [Sphaerochaetaceae bacterium]
MTVAIDGPAGVGKSSIAKLIGKELNLYYLNSGNFYRGATYRILKNNLDPSDDNVCVKATEDAKFDIIDGKFYLDGEYVEKDLHTPAIDLWASKVSVNPKVREIVNKRLQELAGKLDIICEGRDITTVVFPNAEHKFFFDAKAEIRAQRRFDQNPSAMEYDKVLSEINERDQIDRNKPVGGLKIASDAIYIDTSYLTINEVCEKVVRAIKGLNK